MEDVQTDAFENRDITKKVNIHSRFLQSDIKSSLLKQLKMQYQNRCIIEGFVQEDSILIKNYSLGRANYIRGGVDYDVTFQAAICFPHIGQRFEVPVSLVSKIGIHAELEPMKILIPRDLHIGRSSYEQIVKQYEDLKKESSGSRVMVKVEVVGSQFKQGDKEIIVVAKLLMVDEEPKTAEEEVIQEVEVPATPVVSSGTDDKKVVVQETVTKKRLKKNST